MSAISSAILLFLIMDPFGNIPMFLTALKDVDPARRSFIVMRELLIALAVLIVFLFGGQHLLDLMHISEPSLTIGGGILLFLIALRMVFPSPKGVYSEEITGEPLIVPLAIPYVAGPSAMAAVILIGSGEPGLWPQWLAAVLIAWVATAMILMLGTKLARVLGERGLVAIERLMGMLLVAISVEMFLGGLRTFLAQS
jgi:MarC family membrane protein